MKNPFFILSCIFLLTVSRMLPAVEQAPNWPANNSNQVFYMGQFSEFKAISDEEMRFFRKTLERAEKARAKALILELDTPGGSVETAFKYLSIMEKSVIPIIVYLNPNGISAGMIIAMGADRIAISPNGLIGDAMPIQTGLNGVQPVTDPGENTQKETPAAPQPESAKANNTLEKILKELQQLKNPAGEKTENKEEKQLINQKFLSVFFKMLQVLAEKNQRPVNVIRAMADPYTVLTMERDQFAHDKRSPLTLSAREAKQLNVVDYIAGNRTDLLEQLGLSNAEIVEVKRSGSEQIGGFLATPAIAGLLLIIGLVGIFVEVKTPGFGVPGVLGISALTLYFLGHIAAGTSDWGPMVVFFVGVLLLALEIFLVPGFGLVGILGMLCMLLSFFWAFGWSNIETALQVVTFSLLAAIGIMILLACYVLPKTPLFHKVTLTAAMDSRTGCKAQSADPELIGCIGIAITPLRPSGVIRIGQERHDAASEGDFLEAGETVIVTNCNGFQLTVRRSQEILEENS